jgi:hypothetical protein
MLIELMEKGWTPTFKIEECGFNLGIYRVESRKAKFEFPRIRKLYRKMMMNDDQEKDINAATSNNNNNNNKDQALNEICAICHDKLTYGSVVRLNCSHMFHSYCIYQHFHKIGANSDLCPICRSQVVQELPKPGLGVDDNTSEDGDSDDDDDESTEIDEHPSNNINLVHENSSYQAQQPPPPPPPTVANPQIVEEEDDDSHEIGTTELERLILDYESDQVNGMGSVEGNDD